MTSRRSARDARPVVESLEERQLLSGSSLTHPAVIRSAIVARLRPTIAWDPAGATAIMNALNGGMGREWVKLVRGQVRNLASIVGRFMSGRLTAYSVSGFTVKTPSVQPQFSGQPYDQLLPTAAGAAVFKGNVLELGAIMRGPFHDPAPSTYVFAFNRGAGSGLGPTFSSVPGITPDALVTLTVGPYGSSASGTLTDLTTGATQSIPPSAIKIQGPVVRVYLNTSQLPSRGWPLPKYRFAFWTQTQPGNDITSVAGFAPDGAMIPIGVLKGVAPTR